MRITTILSLCFAFLAPLFAQSQVIKEINYLYEKVPKVSTKGQRKDVFVYGSDKNKVQVLDFKRDSGQADFDTIVKYNIVYDTAKNVIAQTSYIKKGPGNWKKQSEVITSYSPDKSISEIEWKIMNSKDKLVPYRKFVYSYDAAKHPKEIQYMAADSTGKFKPDSKLDYEYNSKGMKTCSMTNLGADGKWLKLSMYTVMFDSMNVVEAMMKFKNGNRLGDRYSIENSYNASTDTRTITFKNYHPETQEFAGKALDDSYAAINYKGGSVSLITSYARDIRGNKWVKDETARYTYGDAGHALNNVLKAYMKYDPLATRFNDYVNESVITDVNNIIDGSKLSTQQINKCTMLSADGAMIKYFVQ